MRPPLRICALVLLFLVTLAACEAPAANAPAPTSTPAARPQLLESDPGDPFALVTGRYQLMMLYSPL